ncbi:hypothetical protein Patl1_07173 [Pistacia atlantica]|uniref:Uncharacterized protein n=1 Tax=Pistacia atlantica TaxID=434234 RepID=A0ACC1ALH9_9ROSI|nr:hypothetical protein Patl1_07173 [Pistacia atlantica]
MEIELSKSFETPLPPQRAIVFHHHSPPSFATPLPPPQAILYKPTRFRPPIYPLPPPPTYPFQRLPFELMALIDKLSWAYDVRTILISVQSLLGEPNISFPLNSQAAQLWSNREECLILIGLTESYLPPGRNYLTKASLNHADRIELLLALIRTGFHDTAHILHSFGHSFACFQSSTANVGRIVVEVKKLNPLDVEAKNRDGKTPRALFSQEHQKLKDDGEKWMKDTANYCMVVALLITTMVFLSALGHVQWHQ